MVAIAIISVVMTSLTSFFVTTLATTNFQAARQGATQVADAANERVRALKGSSLAAGRDLATSDTQRAQAPAAVVPYLTGTTMAYDPAAVAPSGTTAALPAAAVPVPFNGLTYQQNIYLQWCGRAPAVDSPCVAAAANGDVPAGYAAFFRVVIAVTWTDRQCAASTCLYATTTLVSDAATDPLFNSNRQAQPPRVTNRASRTGEVSVPITPLTIAATGGMAPLTWSASGLPPGLSMASNGQITGVPTVAGIYPVTATVTDAYQLVGSAGFVWTIVALPALANPGPLSTPYGTAVSRSIAVTGGTFASPLVSPAGWSATGLPTGLAINATTGLITGTPSVAGAPRPVTVTVTDSYGKPASTTFDWAVVPAVTLPRTAPWTDPVGTPMSSATFGVSGGTAPYTWSIVNAPAGVAVAAGTGVISGTPAAGTRYLATVTVTDAHGLTGSATVVWNITATGPVLRVTAPTGDRSDVAGTSVTVSPSVMPGGNGRSWAASGLPPGMSINTGTGTITGTPTTAGGYTVRLTVTDSGASAVVMFTWTIT
jgi:hypothetical protein